MYTQNIMKKYIISLLMFSVLGISSVFAYSVSRVPSSDPIGDSVIYTISGDLSSLLTGASAYVSGCNGLAIELVGSLASYYGVTTATNDGGTYNITVTGIPSDEFWNTSIHWSVDANGWTSPCPSGVSVNIEGDGNSVIFSSTGIPLVSESVASTTSQLVGGVITGGFSSIGINLLLILGLVIGVIVAFVLFRYGIRKLKGTIN